MSSITTSLPLVTVTTTTTATTTEDVLLTPAAAFRNKYYLSQQQQQQDITDDEEDDFIYRPGAIIYAPLGRSNTVMACKDDKEETEDDNISIKTIDDFDSDEEEEEEEITLFEPKSNLEPKITLVDKENYHTSSNTSKLISKLSKSTAPIKAKLSTLSRSKSE
jgi:hypothetical protein